LLLHGALHLLGYDHIKKADVVEMQVLEARLLKKIK
jgi:ssRNA-specific RNase YbeY (16S rRNA maturation enzyme)